ncbi:MAG: F0F1 ATP synthase subunit gamma [Chthoniobacteraceae bacterium]
MSDTLQTLRRKIHGAGELESVVRTMRAISAASIGQYERAVLALGDYYRTVELGLLACLRQPQFGRAKPAPAATGADTIGAVVFGSDQGLVGQFNDTMAEFIIRELAGLPGQKTVWAVGDRIHSRLSEAGLRVARGFSVPNSVNSITPIVGSILIECDAHRAACDRSQVYIFHQRPKAGAICEPVIQRLLPLDEHWRSGIAKLAWPTQNLPAPVGSVERTLESLIREYLFVSLFKACAESLASENASRLAAMQRAKSNIDQIQEDLGRTFHQLRQNAIDDELFDLIAGFDALVQEKTR